MNRLPRRVAGLALAALVAVSLSACGTPPWEEAASTPGPTASSTPAPKPTGSGGEITTVVNELSNGSAKHLLTAGAIGLSVDYYSTLSMDQWTASANKPVSIAMSAALGTDDGQAVYLSNLTVLVAVYGPEGKLDSRAQLVDRPTVTPGYYIKAPYTYGQTFVLPAVDPDATYVQLTLTYEMLLQTTPGSPTYSKQTASDTLTVAIAQE